MKRLPSLGALLIAVALVANLARTSPQSTGERVEAAQTFTDITAPPNVDAETLAEGGDSPDSVATPGKASATKKAADETPAPTSRGVTNDQVTIGFAGFSTGSFGALVPAYNIGPNDQMVESVLQAWRASGRDIVNGRRIKVVYREMSITDPETQRAACTGLIDDESSFAVVSSFGMGVGQQCVTVEKKTPLVVSQPVATEAMFREEYPNLFTAGAPVDVTMRNFAYWLRAQNLIAGRKIGLYYNSAGSGVVAQFKAALARVGGNLAAEVKSESTQATGPDDSVAAQRFRTAGVDIAILFTNGIGQTTFMQSADSQGYKPKYVASDVGVITDDTATSTFPAEQYEGARAMTSMMYGQFPLAPPAESERCLADYVKSSRRNPPKGRAEWNFLMQTCQVLELAHMAMERSGRVLTPARYVAALETVNYDSAFGPVQFAPGPAGHAASKVQRTIEWHADRGDGASGWRNVSPFEPFFVS